MAKIKVGDLSGLEIYWDQEDNTIWTSDDGKTQMSLGVRAKDKNEAFVKASQLIKNYK